MHVMRTPYLACHQLGECKNRGLHDLGIFEYIVWFKGSSITFLRSLYRFWALLFFSWCAFCLFIADAGSGPRLVCVSSIWLPPVY